MIVQEGKKEDGSKCQLHVKDYSHKVDRLFKLLLIQNWIEISINRSWGKQLDVYLGINL